jgi:hypothetical protein
MTRSTLLIAVAALLATTPAVSAQRSPPVPEDRQVQRLPRQQLSGPRFGFTTFTGDVARMRQDLGKSTIMAQFGWQFETQIMSTETGGQALMEWLLLVGGMEQDDLSTGLAWIAGYRLESGLEFGVGPNFSWNRNSEDLTTSMVAALGASIPAAGGDILIPVNVAVAFAEGGPRITTLAGWIIG